jgi:hypothetical protein
LKITFLGLDLILNHTRKSLGQIIYQNIVSASITLGVLAFYNPAEKVSDLDINFAGLI